MTTIIGIEAKKDNSVILASDLSATRTHWSPQGDVVYRRQTKEETQKIDVNYDGRVAFATAGRIDKEYLDFLESLLQGEIDIPEIISTKDFKQLKELNVSRWEGKVPEGNMTSFLMATRFEDPGLYTCWPLGKVEPRKFTAIGSGDEYALDYLMKYGERIHRGLPLTECIDLAVNGLQEASRDIYTAGLDLVVVSPDKIHEFGSDIKEAIESAKDRTIKKIKKSFSRTPDN